MLFATPPNCRTSLATPFLPWRRIRVRRVVTYTSGMRDKHSAAGRVAADTRQNVANKLRFAAARQLFSGGDMWQHSRVKPRGGGRNSALRGDARTQRQRLLRHTGERRVPPQHAGGSALRRICAHLLSLAWALSTRHRASRLAAPLCASWASYFAAAFRL